MDAIGKAAVNLVRDVLSYQEGLETLRKELAVWMLSTDYIKLIATT